MNENPTLNGLLSSVVEWRKNFSAGQGTSRLSKSSFLAVIFCVENLAFSNAQLALTGYNRVSDYYGFEIALPQVVSVPSLSL